MLQHIGSREIAGIYQENLAITKVWFYAFNQVLVIIGLYIDDDNLALTDGREISGYMSDLGISHSSLFNKLNRTAMLQKVIEVLVMHGIGRFNKCHRVSAQAQFCGYSCSAVTGT